MSICDVTAIHDEAVQKVKEESVSSKDLEKVATLFKLMGDPTRVQILSALAVTELCVCDIAYVLDKTQSAISHQLRSLRDGGLVKSRKDGKVVYYSLADRHVETLFEQGVLHAKHI